MDPHVKEVVLECTRASDEERIGFPEVVGKLAEAGVERYLADLVRGDRTYYLPGGESQPEKGYAVTGRPADDFSPSAVRAALGAIQKGEIRYREFCERIAAGGCVGYMVSLPGRRALYFGRTADYYVEHFPGAK